MANATGSLDDAEDPAQSPDKKDVARVHGLLRRGATAEARTRVDALLARFPGSTTARGLEVELLLALERLDEASALAESLAQSSATSPRIRYLAGRAAYRTRRYEEAERHLRESLRLLDHSETRRLLAKTLSQRGALEEAEALLLALVERIDACRLDLAWIHERRGDLAAARGELEAYVERHPRSDFARSRLQQLRAAAVGDEELLAEVAALEELDEPIPAEWIPRLCEALARSGEAAELDRVVAEALRRLEPRDILQVAWACWRARADRQAVALFLRGFDHGRRNEKLLGALEGAARRSGQLAEVIAFYDARIASGDTALEERRASLAERRPPPR